MAGTIFGLPLSQRVDSNGQPAVGWLLYLYQANTSTPVNSYQDTALTVLNPWPLAADASGMMRQFWLADGSYRARATSADGSQTYFDLPSVLAIGASTGAAPSGGVDPNAIFQTGDLIWRDTGGVRTGWVRENGRSIGSATSGASERANADCQPLFEFLWNNFDNTTCPVSGGIRGASATADFVANRQITLPDKRGCGIIGADDMGNTAAGRFTGVPVAGGSVTTPGSKVGENTHGLTGLENGPHAHSVYIYDPSHGHGLTGQPTALSNPGFGLANGTGLTTGTDGTAVQANYTGVRITNTPGGGPADATASSGSGTAHNTVQNSIIGTFYRKL